MKKYVLITGASSNVGKAIAFEFGSKGHNLILADEKKDLLESVKRDIENIYDVKIIVEDVDFTSIKEIDDFYNNVRHYEIEVLINSAEISDFDKVFDLDLNQAHKMINLNITAMTNLTLKYVKDYIDKKGTIINMSSISGYFIPRAGGVFSGTKFYVSSFSEGIAKQLKNSKSDLSMKVFAPSSAENSFLQSKVDDASKNNIETRNSIKWIPFEDIATNVYKLYKSDMTVAIVDLEKNSFEFLDNVFSK